MTFSAKTSGSDDLKAIISAISTQVEEATFVADTSGITFRGMDPSHVALIDISWPSGSFEKYECDSEIKFGVRIDEFAKLIKRADKSDSIEIGISDDNQLLINIGSSKKYKMRLIESSATETPLPNMTYDSKITVKLARLDKILGDVQVVSEFLTIDTDDDKVSFSGKGDTGEVTVEADLSEEGELVESSAKSTGTYSLEYLNPVVKAVSGSGQATCEYSSAKPLRMEFVVGTVGRIHFYLAPRVEN